MSANPAPDMESEHLEHFTPSREDLCPSKEFKCPEVDCRAAFHNRSHYVMHMSKRHGVSVTKMRSASKYHCPEDGCLYHEDNTHGKYFSNFKYLKQHFQKIHLTKAHSCGRCKKAFITESKLVLHEQKSCGKVYMCHDCSWKFESREALLMHMKRKKHSSKDNTIDDCAPSTSARSQITSEMKRSSDAEATQISDETNDNEVEQKDDGKQNVEKPTSSMGDKRTLRQLRPRLVPVTTDVVKEQMEVQPIPEKPEEPVTKPVEDERSEEDLLNSLDSDDRCDLDVELRKFDLVLRSIETQTDHSSNSYMDMDDLSILDTIIESTNMYTQTGDELTRNLDSSDMETQTNWSTLNEGGMNANHATDNIYSNNIGNVQHLNVAHATQNMHPNNINNVQHLNSVIQVNPISSHLNQVNVGNGMMPYQTQYTQNGGGDAIMQNLVFNSNSAELNEGIQETNTQN